LTSADATTDPARLARWWGGTLDLANLATVAGRAFDVVELSYQAPAEQVAAWLRAHDVEAGPVIDTGDTTRFLVGAGAGAAADLVGAGSLDNGRRSAGDSRPAERRRVHA
jgi:hypothetical protein